MSLSPYVKQTPKIYSLLTRNAKHWKNGILYIYFLKYLTKIVFKKLKLPFTEFCVFMAQVDTQNSVNSIRKALLTILRIISQVYFNDV